MKTLSTDTYAFLHVNDGIYEQNPGPSLSYLRRPQGSQIQASMSHFHTWNSFLTPNKQIINYRPLSSIRR
jgi:hypothetical protein